MWLYQIAYAADSSPGILLAKGFVSKVNEVILFPLIILLTAIAFLIFIYGCFIFIANANNPSAREVGRGHIMWGLIGMLVMLGAYSILLVATNTFGLGDELNCADDPEASGCEGRVFELPVVDTSSPPTVKPPITNPNPNPNPNPTGKPNESFNDRER